MFVGTPAVFAGKSASPIALRVVPRLTRTHSRQEGEMQWRAAVLHDVPDSGMCRWGERLFTMAAFGG